MNPYKGDTSFSVAGKTYTLRYNHAALILIENRLDRGLMKVIEEMSSVEGVRIGTVVAILWAGLQSYHPKMTFDDAAGLLDDIEGGTGAMVSIIGDSFQKAFSAPGTKGTNPPQKEGNGTGMESGSISLPSDMSQIASGKLHPGS
jgi:Phage tail tube protein, GTA-gp10